MNANYLPNQFNNLSQEHIHALEDYLMSNEDKLIETEYGNALLVKSDHDLKKLPAFTQAILGEPESLTVISDARRISPSNRSEYTNMLVKSFLMMQWESGYRRKHRVEYRLAMATLVSTLNFVIYNNYGLDLSQRQVLVAIIADYVASLLVKPEEAEDKVLHLQIMGRIANIHSTLMQRIEKKAFSYPDGITSLAENIASANISVKMRGITPGKILNLMSGVAYGAASKMDIALGVIYPPVFTYLVYHQLTNQRLKHSLLAKQAINNAKKYNGPEFLKGLADTASKLDSES